MPNAKEIAIERRITLRDRARAMRTEPTAGEKKLWLHLRGDQLLGLRFRRQHRIGDFIADFFCPARKLIIEVDSDSHDVKSASDLRRDTVMMSLGLQVLRFRDDDVLKCMDGVLEEIRKHCEI